MGKLTILSEYRSSNRHILGLPYSPILEESGDENLGIRRPRRKMEPWGSIHGSNNSLKKIGNETRASALSVLQSPRTQINTVNLAGRRPSSGHSKKRKD